MGAPTRLILVTAAEGKAGIFEEIFDLFIHKPFEPDEFLRKIDMALRQQLMPRKTNSAQLEESLKRVLALRVWSGPGANIRHGTSLSLAEYRAAHTQNETESSGTADRG